MRGRGHLVASPHGYEAVEWLALQRPRALRRLRTIFPNAGTAEGNGEWFEELRHFPVNPTHSFWYELVECCGFPFLKTEMLMRNPQGLIDVDRLVSAGLDRPQRHAETDRRSSLVHGNNYRGAAFGNRAMWVTGRTAEL